LLWALEEVGCISYVRNQGSAFTMSGLRRAGSKEDIFCKVTQCCVRSIDTHPGVAQLCFWSKQAVVCRMFGTQSLGTNGVMAAWVSPLFILSGD
jgi:hypothetical protein